MLQLKLLYIKYNIVYHTSARVRVFPLSTSAIVVKRLLDVIAGFLPESTRSGVGRWRLYDLYRSDGASPTNGSSFR